MKFSIIAYMSTEKANEKAMQGNLIDTIENIIEEIKPEHVYFGGADALKGRSCTMIVDLFESSDIMKICEPWLLAFNSTFEITPIMTLEDIKKGKKHIKKSSKIIRI